MNLYIVKVQEKKNKNSERIPEEIGGVPKGNRGENCKKVHEKE